MEIKMKKKILIVGLSMEVGGAERALLGLLNEISTDEYDVDLFLQRHVGEFMQYIPPNINLLDEIEEYTNLAVPMKKLLKKRKYKFVIGRLVAKFKSKRFNKKIKNFKYANAVELEYSHKYTKKLMPMISNECYDLVISFCSPHYFAYEKTNAKKKIAWIHTDYDAIDIDVESEFNMWKVYDYIISISDACTKSFIKIFPQLSNKIEVIENILPSTLISEQAQEEIKENFLLENDEIKILSIGRFCSAKNFDNVPEICRLIRNKGLNVKWYLMGYGNGEELIREKIKEQEMEKNVILLGKQENPYPYIKYCDLYVQPSRYEGKSVTVREAQLLGKPVVITKFETSFSQLEDGVDGVIVPMDNEGCAEGIVSLLNNPEKMQILSANCKSRDYSNKKEINKIYRLMDGNLNE